MPSTQLLVAVEVRWLTRPEIRAADLIERVRTLAGTEVGQLGDSGPAQGFAFPGFTSTCSDGSVPMQVWLALPDAAHQQSLPPEAFRQTWDWADAARVMGEAGESLLVTDLMAGGVAPVDRLRLFHAVLRSVVEAYGPVGLYVLSAERAVEAGAYLETVATDPAAFASTVNVRLFSVDGDTGMALFDTLGMAPLGLPDVQLQFAGLDLDAAARWVFNVAYHLFENGDAIEDGHTLSGVDPDEAWPCRHLAAMAAPGRRVLDADPWPHGPRREPGAGARARFRARAGVRAGSGTRSGAGGGLTGAALTGAALPAGAARYHHATMTDRPETPPLPDHVRRIVDEIETDMGEDSIAPPPVSGTTGRIEAAVREILMEIGEDPDREGLQNTPERLHRMYYELTAGYHVDPERLINHAIFEVGYSEMVVVKDIPFYSLCEHHLLPFFGSAHVAYVPDGHVIGLSKIPRIVEMYGRRLQVQERMTQQIADFLMERLAPLGVGVVLEATHLCAAMRGVRKPGTVMTTAAVLGLFRRNDKTRAEFFAHLGRPAPGA